MSASIAFRFGRLTEAEIRRLYVVLSHPREPATGEALGYRGVYIASIKWKVVDIWARQPPEWVSVGQTHKDVDYSATRQSWICVLSVLT